MIQQESRLRVANTGAKELLASVFSVVRAVGTPASATPSSPPSRTPSRAATSRRVMSSRRSSSARSRSVAAPTVPTSSSTRTLR